VFHLSHAGWRNFEETVRLMREPQNMTAVMEGPSLFPLYDYEPPPGADFKGSDADKARHGLREPCVTLRSFLA
jgi:hypothetical protein